MPIAFPSIEQMLIANGPGLSTRLCAALEAQGLSPQAARQRVSRANGPVRRLQGLKFPRGARFLYHQTNFRSEGYWNALLRDIGEAGPAYAAAIAALRARGGVVPLSHFDVISGAPVAQQGQIASDAVLRRLEAIQVLETFEVPSVGTCVGLAAGGHFSRISKSALRARLLTEKILLLAIKDWARKLGVASYDKIALRDDAVEAPRVGTFRWDLTGPSYMRPMIRRAADGKPKPGFLVCDVAVGTTLDEKAVGAFIRKCLLLGQLRRIAPVLPVLVADRFTPEGLHLGKAQGVMMATPSALFGDEVAAGLTALLRTLTKAAAVAVKQPEVIGELFGKLSGIEGAAANLRGALFEMIVGYCVQRLDHGLIDIGKEVVDPESGARAEIDVFRIKTHQEVWSYECKAHQPDELVSEQTVKLWIEERVPIIHRALSKRDDLRDYKFYYEFWTCGVFSSDAIQMLEAAKSRTKRYAIGWKDRHAVQSYVKSIKPKSVLKTLDQHFFKHPISRISQRYDMNGILEAVDLEQASMSDADTMMQEFMPKPSWVG